jgi:uncharacterized protein YbjT (DUF2867 family)
VRVAIAGAHGQIGRRLTRLLHAEGDEVVGLVRNPRHDADVREDGGEPVVCDLETASPDAVAEAVRGCDAVVFAAGAGPGSGAERKLTMDRDGAIALLRGCEAAGVPRYVMVSAMGAADPPQGDEVFAVYLRAKADADRALRASRLRWTIVRPGALTDEPGGGLVRAGERLERGDIARDDVAAVLAAVVRGELAVGRSFDVVRGAHAVHEALRALEGASGGATP